MTTPVDISVVVCTYNRADMLRDTLASLAAQQTEGRFRYEVLVVDNASTDHTPQVLADIAANFQVPLRCVRELQQGPACARNRGVAEAQGEWVANFDDDQLADPRWLLELFTFARGRDLRSVGGAVRLRLPEEASTALSPVCRRVLGESVDWPMPRPYTRKEGPGAGNQLLHRSVFDQVGLYDVAYNFRGEDTDLYRRIRAAGIESWYTPSAIAWHVIPPDRLQERYLRATSIHNGHCFARRDREEWGRLALALVLAARVGQAALVNVPRFVWAHLRRAREEALAARCLFWRMEGYLQCAATLMFHDPLARHSTPAWRHDPARGASR